MAPWRRFLPLIVALAIMVSGIWLGRVTAQTAEPGSAADPLVSRSYVDQMALFRVMTVPAGQTIIGEGGTEIVLRGGKATAITTPQGGLLNVSAGTDMQQGEEIPPNHLIIIPRNDGRGFKAETDLVLMVKGPAVVGPSK
ncbi:MAG: hypothetical protein ACOY94_11050 [Bacillota bacterium]